MSSKNAILEVTARLFADHGWRGTTTRRIAEEAGVNEVTLFRQFRSKEALLGEAIRMIAVEVHPARSLPAVPVRLRDELVEWAAEQHRQLRRHSALIRNCLAEFEEHPELAPIACEGSVNALGDAVRYFTEARSRGLIGPGGSLESATMMLMNAVFLDAVTRDVVSGCHTLPETEVIAEFVDLTLRALGARED